MNGTLPKIGSRAASNGLIGPGSPAEVRSSRDDALQLAYRLACLPLAFGLGGALALAWGLWPHLPRFLLVGWLSFLVLTTALHLLQLRLWSVKARSGSDLQGWPAGHVFLSGCAALAWGAACWLLLPDLLPLHQMGYLAWIAVLACLQAASLAMLAGAVPFVAGALLLPAAAWALIQGSEHGWLPGSALLILYGVLVALGRQTVTAWLRIGSRQAQLDSEVRTLGESNRQLARTRDELEQALREQIRAAHHSEHSP